MKTRLEIKEDRFFINGSPTYQEIVGVNPAYQGLLMNARMIQAIFDEKENPQRFDRYGKTFNPDRNTDEMICALPQWYAKGLRAVTVGFQGGGPCFTINNYTMRNNPYSEDGTEMDPAYLNRMARIIEAADDLGMVVIVSLFYGPQTRFLKDDTAIMQSVKTACNWLRDQKYTNVIIEIANEHDVGDFKCHPIVYSAKGVVSLIDIAKRESGGIPVGCSGQGGTFDEEIAQASDVILIHGNNQTSQKMYNMIVKSKEITPKRPIVFNEDSQAISRLSVAFREGVSWGYYNNMTKQEPPTYWEITEGEDAFFAARLAQTLGIEENTIPFEKQFYLQGLEPCMTYEGKRWIRLAALFPEKIDYVEFFRNEEMVGRAYNEPFMLNSIGSTWIQRPFPKQIVNGEVWKAKVYLHDGRMAETSCIVKG